MNPSIFSRILVRASIVTLGLLVSLPSASAGFEKLYQGTPDLVLNAIEQVSATSFRVVVCNQGDMSTGAGQIWLVLQSNEWQVEERTYKNVSIPSGTCAAYVAQAVDGYTQAGSRKVSVTGTIRFEGSRKELKLSNNRLTLPAKRSRVDASDISARTSTVSKDPVYDLWGNSESGVSWYNSNTNSSGYTSSPSYGTAGGTNGDIDPSSPTWAMRQNAQNIVYVYTAPGSGNWYSYVPSSNGTYVYRPYTPDGYSSTYTRTNVYNTFTAPAPTSTNTYHTIDPVTWPQSGYSYVGSDSACYRWNSSWNRYEWICNTGGSGNWNSSYSYGQPDLYLSDLRQNGTKSELIARICNQAGAMDTSRQITLRISNGNYSTAVSTYVQLQQRGCSDVTIGFGNLNLNLTGAVYLLYGEVDLYNNVSETREDNNTSYWRLRVQ